MFTIFINQKVIICFQDAHFFPEMEPFVEAVWGYKCFLTHIDQMQEISLFFNNKFEYKVHEVKRDEGGHLIALDLTIEDNRVTHKHLWIYLLDNFSILNPYIRVYTWHKTPLKQRLSGSILISESL